jgi:hypothetical protein
LPKDIAPTALHLAHDEQPEADDQDHRKEIHQDRAQRDAAGGLFLDDFHVLATQHVDQVAIQRCVDGGRLAATGGVGQLVGAAAQVAAEGDLLHVAAVHLVQELRIGRALGAGAGGLRREALEHHHEHHGDDHPQQEVLGQVVHPHWLRCSSNA